MLIEAVFQRHIISKIIIIVWCDEGDKAPHDNYLYEPAPMPEQKQKLIMSFN